MARATFLLPARARFGGQRLSPGTARALGRADRVDRAERADSGDADGPAQAARSQLRRHFTLVPDHWPVAALARRAEAGDAEGACWLRADPAHIRASINGAVLLACGDGLALQPAEAEALLQPLRPLFGDAGFPIDAPAPGHWYLRLPPDARPPRASEPADALGDDVTGHLPEGEGGRRWRALLSEAQVILHNHPANAARVAAGALPVNSLWFWGGGVLPDVVASPYARLQSDDEVARALAHGVAGAEALPPAYARPDDAVLVDLRAMRDLAALERHWLRPALDDVAGGALPRLQLDFADGHVVDFARGQRWRLWRRPAERLGA